MKSTLLRLLPAPLLVAFLLMPGCGGGGGGTSELPDPTIYFVNGSADAGALDFLLDEDIQEAALAYLGTSPDFEQVDFVSDDDGGYRIGMQEAEGGLEFDAEIATLARESHTIVAGIGIRNFIVGEELKRLRFVRFTVDRNAPIGNKSRLYVLHGFNRAPGFMTPNIRFQTPGDNPLFQVLDIAYSQQKQLTVDSGTYTWQALRQDADGDVIYASTVQTVDPGGIYLALVSGIENDPDPARQPKITFFELQPD